VRIDNDCVNGLGGTSPRSQGQDKENKALFHVPLFHTVVKPAHASTDTANSDFTAQISTSLGCKAKRMELIEIAKTKIAERTNGKAPSHLLRAASVVWSRVES